MRALCIILATVPLCVMAACGSDTSTGPSNIAGTYTLVTLNGVSLPANPVRPGDPTATAEYITADTIILHANHTFYWATVYDFPPLTTGDTNQTYSDNTTGTYAVHGNTILLTWQVDPAATTSGTMTGTMTNGVLTMTYWNTNFPAVYWKQ